MFLVKHGCGPVQAPAPIPARRPGARGPLPLCPARAGPAAFLPRAWLSPAAAPPRAFRLCCPPTPGAAGTGPAIPRTPPTRGGLHGAGGRGAGCRGAGCRGAGCRKKILPYRKMFVILPPKTS